MYDHRVETKYWRSKAATLRAQAVELRLEAERGAHQLEQEANRKDQLADHICALAAGAGATCCKGSES